MHLETPLIGRAASAAAVFVGGAFGASARWGIVRLVGEHGAFRTGTFFSNLVGAAILGFLAGRVAIRPGRGVLWALAGVGLAGALTTFSGFVIEGVLIAEGNGLAAAVLYVGVSVVAGLWVAAVARTRGAAR